MGLVHDIDFVGRSGIGNNCTVTIEGWITRRTIAHASCGWGEIADGSIIRGWLSQFSAEGLWPCQCGFTPNDFLHRLLRLNPRAAGFTPTRRTKYGHLQV